MSSTMSKSVEMLEMGVPLYMHDIFVGPTFVVIMHVEEIDFGPKKRVICKE